MTDAMVFEPATCDAASLSPASCFEAKLDNFEVLLRTVARSYVQTLGEGHYPFCLA